jgi:hypothetical protein
MTAPSCSRQAVGATVGLIAAVAIATAVVGPAIAQEAGSPVGVLLRIVPGQVDAYGALTSRHTVAEASTGAGGVPPANGSSRVATLYSFGS